MSTKYQIVIQKTVGRSLRISPGLRLKVDVVQDRIVLSRAKTKTVLQWPDDYLKTLNNPWRDKSAKIYLQKERASWK
ncbi:MAG TPA: AbrB/MazE/SpoVT family DNA-binding domain-containing protein [Patescibacteria group bacterium]|nr:AbrB/MazE/SpoVT family DNA-binding domain-containing protein [Patescibacteria group bacterium]